MVTRQTLAPETLNTALFVLAGTGVNDNLNGIERPVSFPIKDLNEQRAEIVQSLAKWKRMALADYSFNAGEGRCPTCGGSGFEHVEMQFLSDVYLRCPDCDGRRFRAELLDVKLVRGAYQLSVADVLDLTVAEACIVFSGEPAVTMRLSRPR